MWQQLPSRANNTRGKPCSEEVKGGRYGLAGGASSALSKVTVLPASCYPVTNTMTAASNS